MSGTSEEFSLDKNDFLNLTKNTALVATAAALTFVSENLSNLDLGPSTVFVVPVAALLIHAALRWVHNYKKDSKQN